MTGPYQPHPAGPAITSPLSRLARIVAAAALVLAIGHAACRADPSLGASVLVLDPRAPERTTFGALELLAGFVLTEPGNRFGGYSGMSVDADGRSLVLLSDRATWLEIELRHDDAGRLVGFGAARDGVLLAADGTRLGDADSEALSALPSGGYAVSFERRPRIDAYPDGLDASAKPMFGSKVFGRVPWNGGLEAMTALPDGGFVALVEDPEPDGSHRGFLIAPDGAVATFAYETEPAFKPTDVARLPAGDLIVLERKFNLIEGANARLVRVAAATVRAGARVQGRELARLSPPLATDNFEGLGVRPAPGGGTLLYVVSDDNFKPYQRTLLLQFRLSE